MDYNDKNYLEFEKEHLIKLEELYYKTKNEELGYLILILRRALERIYKED